MTLAPVVWADGYGSQTLTAYNTGGVLTFTPGGGRGGRACLNMVAGSSWTINPPLASGLDRWIFTVAIKPTNSVPDFALRDTGASNRFQAIATGGGLQMRNSAGAGLGGIDTTPPLPANAWTSVAIAVYFHASAGTVDVWMNESQVIHLTGLALSRGGGVVQLSSDITAFGNCSLGDLIVQASSGSTDTEVGDRAVIWLPPSGAGSNTNWTPLTGSNWSEVSESPPDGDTSYNSASTPGTIDTYAMTDLGAGVVSVQGVVAKWVVRKTDAGSREVAPEWHISGTNYEGTPQVMGVNYGQAYQAYPLNPDTSSAWTISDINSAELGVDLDS